MTSDQKTSKDLKAHLGACCYGYFSKASIKAFIDSFYSNFVLALPACSFVFSN